MRFYLRIEVSTAGLTLRSCRRRILDAVIEIHRAKVVHNRLLRQYRHVLLSPIPESGELQPLIIDFKYAKSDHQCPVEFHRGRGQFRVGDWQPQSDHVSCYELYHFTECLRVWINGMLSQFESLVEDYRLTLIHLERYDPFPWHICTFH